MLCFSVAKELSMTLSQLLANATREEIIGWSVFFEIRNDEMDRLTKKK